MTDLHTIGLDLHAKKGPEIHPPMKSSADPCTLVIVGITGDLAHRKLIPALYNLEKGHLLPDGVRVVGMGRHDVPLESLMYGLKEAAAEHSRTQPIDQDVWHKFAQRFDYIANPGEGSNAFGKLAKVMEEHKEETEGNRMFYFATPPSAFGLLLKRISRAGLIHSPREKAWTRVILEKPIGHDHSSAVELNRLTADYLDERQTYRIDHYLGKETVQNILIFRYANAIFEPLWNRNHIDHVQIEACETIGTEGRGSFYDHTGVVRDIVQNHLLQVLGMVTMEPPNSFHSEAIRDEKVKVFRSLRRIYPQDVGKDILHGQYRGYRDNEGVADDSRTPTAVAMRFWIDNWRWQGVPFYLRAGKRLEQKVTQVSIHFKSIPLCLFGDDEACQQIEPNVLTLRIQPDEGISLAFNSKVPGDAINVGSVTMDMSYERAFQKPIHDAYERLVLDCMRGDATLFARRDGVEQSWKFIDPLIKTWESTKGPVLQYEQGSTGPQEFHDLIEKDGRRWHHTTTDSST